MRVNKLFFSGRLCRDPEVRFTAGSDAVVGITLAQDTVKKQGNEWIKGEAIFVDATIWGKRGEAFARHHQKGDMALIEGRLRLDRWEDSKTGEKRQKLKIDVIDWHFAKSESSPDNEGPPGSASHPGGDYPRSAVPPNADDTPF